ncbi:hypothetical protein SAMN05192561_104161 [Halopenitus malekzadehii]|uniref:C2H2-type domain-containing protein n=1 Tax=Halopenitus malekzadehii TaxID=1267564 RepID=A0A1H6J175_9EURY|nr:HNH endonuclease [Halopenitus malekzadehii]SEH52621.1 hypothetical protein SAMN05192561_104161 [Halopenitus malekzadehii]
MGHQCPQCDEYFESRRGLGVHHSQIHGEKLPNRTCDHCGERFHSPYARRYCSEECLDRSGAYAGENNPNYRGGTTTTSCDRCGSEFEYYPSEKPGKYCRSCVESGDWQDPPTVSGTDHPNWKGGTERCECSVCGTSVERRPFERDRYDVVLCSRSCHAKWLSESFAGEGHPNWTGGSDRNYGPGWAAVRRRALERDEYACVNCGTTRSELGRNPDVHHLLPVRLFAESDRHTIADAHYLGNVVTLCPGCHRRAEHDRIPEIRLRESASLTG